MSTDQPEGAEIPEALEGIATDPPLKRIVTKRVREYDVIESDRIQLVVAANEFISHIVTKQVWPAMGSAMIHAEIPLSDNEVKTLDAALQFLRRQFERGYLDTEPHEKRVETEETQEY